MREFLLTHRILIPTLDPSHDRLLELAETVRAARHVARGARAAADDGRAEPRRRPRRSAAIWPSTWKSPAIGPTAWATSASPARSPVLWGCAADDSRRAAGGRQDAGRRAGQGADRLPRPLPALHGPGDSRREDRAEPRVDGPAAGDDRHHADQQRGRYQQLRADGVRPAAAHVRLREAARARRSSSAGRWPGETIEAIDHKTYRAGAGDVHDCRRQRARWPSAA